ncbi:MAG: SDR family NAD(P)-dependent oxidoreductase, partial [Stellaceae bacterium]
MRFANQVALITAAGSGIGRATAAIMAREGALVIGVDNDTERLDRLVAELRAAGGTAHARPADALAAAAVEG